uniref:Uncharacterized protein n=1 Tax=Aegilops tauschii subsp. strangulata TaxID=200361 RepID=A0A453ESE6_AEGTS|nr:uncharacterized protein LOC120976620 [Aegilops tauschii subsp. strangulata]
MAAPSTAAPPDKGASPPGDGPIGGVFSGQEWKAFRERSRRLIKMAKNRERCLKHSRRRVKDLCRKLAGEKGVACFPRNLSVEPYWKSQGASRRGLLFGNYSRGDKNPTTSIANNNNNNAKPMDVVKVATAVSGLTVSDKGAATSAKTTAGQKGRVQEVLAHAPASASLGQVDQVGALAAPVQGHTPLEDSSWCNA